MIIKYFKIKLIKKLSFSLFVNKYMYLKLKSYDIYLFIDIFHRFNNILRTIIHRI